MSYRELARTVRPTFLPLGFLGRLPNAILPLGTLLLVRDATGSYTFAGLAAGVQSLATAAGGVAIGTLADRFGPRRVGVVAAAVNAVAVLALIGSSQSARGLVLGAALLVGLSYPQVGPLVRVNWTHRLRARDGRLLPTALSYEGAADETSFVVGPVVVGVLAASFGAAGPLSGATVLLLGAALPFALRYERHRRSTAAPGAGLDAGRLAVLFGAMAAAGTIFGAAQTGVAAYADRINDVAATGLIYAELGIGSALAGAACAWLPARFPLPARYLTFSAGLLLGMLGLAAGAVLDLLPLAALLCGTAIGPYLVTVFALTDAIAPADRVGLAMTVVSAGSAVGTALGQAVAGVLVDAVGSAGPFAVPPISAAVALLLALGYGARRGGRPIPAV